MKKLSKLTTMKKKRITQGWCQRTLAEKVGVAVSSIGGYERGENPLSDEIASKISELLNCQKGQLFMQPRKLKNKWLAK